MFAIKGIILIHSKKKKASVLSLGDGTTCNVMGFGTVKIKMLWSGAHFG